jgi:uncharacterized protein YjcR
MMLCGAKTRSGQPCKNNAMANGRCRMHGGKSTGPPPEKMVGNKNALKTGEHETIWMDALDDEERVFFHAIETDVVKQIDNEIRLLELRERRMLLRIKRLQEGPEMVTQTEVHTDGTNDFGPYRSDTTTNEAAIDRIQRIEEALTRVQEKKAKFLELKHKIMLQLDKDSSGEGLLKELADVIEQSYKMLGDGQ